jgi:hypothetical protein
MIADAIGPARSSRMGILIGRGERILALLMRDDAESGL